MASRVSVTVNVRDDSRAGIRRVRNQIRQMQRDLARAGQTAQFNLVVPPGSARRVNRTVNRLRRQIGGQAPVRIRTRVVPPPAGGVRRTLLRTLTSPFRTAAATLGGTLQDGIGQGITGAFRTAGPIGMAILATAIMAALSLVGAALAGLLVTALGLAFVGIAGVSAATSDEVQRTWAKAAEKMKAQFKTIGEPLIPVVHDAIHELEKMADRVAPAFRRAMVSAAPAIDEFIDKMLAGFERFGKAMFQPIMKAFEVFGPVFGDVFGDFMQDLGENFAELADIVRENSFEIEVALRVVFKIISGLIEIIAFFAQAWVDGIAMANSAISGLINGALIPLAKVAFATFGAILEAADASFSQIPGMSQVLDGAKEKFYSLRDGAIGSLERMGKSAAAANEKIDRINKTRTLKADIRSFSAKLADARRRLKATHDQKTKPRIRAEINQLINQVRLAKKALASVQGRTVTVRTHYVVTGDTARTPGGHGAQLRAHGGVVGRAATGGVRSNMTMVGEQGPELVDLPTGSRVRSNPDTRRLLGGGGGGGGAAFVFKSSGRRVDDLLLEILREAIHQRGGDPVVVLGG